MGLFSRTAKPTHMEQRCLLIDRNGDEEYEQVHVVGESFYQPALLRVTGAKPAHAVKAECLAELIPEPENPHDANAIKVTITGEQVGHLSRIDAINYGGLVRQMVDAGQPTICWAFVGCDPSRGNSNIGVCLHFPLDI